MTLYCNWPIKCVSVVKKTSLQELFYLQLFALVMVRYWVEEKLAILFNMVIIVAKIGSIMVSAKLPTYPSPELTLTLTFH